jgi:hypothetical protein
MELNIEVWRMNDATLLRTFSMAESTYIDRVCRIDICGRELCLIGALGTDIFLYRGVKGDKEALRLLTADAHSEEEDEVEPDCDSD